MKTKTNPLESLLEAAQRIDSASFSLAAAVNADANGVMRRVSVVVETDFKTPPRRLHNGNGVIMDPPPPPPQQQAMQLYSFNSSGLIFDDAAAAAMPLLRFDADNFNTHFAPPAAMTSSPPRFHLSRRSHYQSADNNVRGPRHLSPCFFPSFHGCLGGFSPPSHLQRCQQPRPQYGCAAAAGVGGALQPISRPMAVISLDRVAVANGGVGGIRNNRNFAAACPSNNKSWKGLTFSSSIRTGASALKNSPPLSFEEKEETTIIDAVTPEDKKEESITIAATPAASILSLPTLFDEDDIPFVSPTHYILGTEVLEAFVVPEYDDDDIVEHDNVIDAAPNAPTKSKKAKKKSNFRAGSIAFRCRFCKHSPHKKMQAPLSTIYPESLGGLYRANLRFQSNHLKKCQYFPQELKEMIGNIRRNGGGNGNHVHKEVKVKKYWIKSASRKGFRNVEEKKGLTFSPPRS